MRVLITGSRGFIGRHAAKHYAQAGHDVTIVDILDGFDCRPYLERAPRFDLVVHAAAVIGGRMGIEHHSALLMAENLSIDAALFRYVLRRQPGHVVYLSSSAVYPIHLQRQPGTWLHETHMGHGDPDQTYGWTKLTAERFIGSAATSTRWHVARPFSGYGEDQGEDYPFGAILARVRRRENPLIVWGSGHQARDFVHIDDIVATIALMVEENVPGPLNIGWGIPTTFDELAREAAMVGRYQPTLSHAWQKPHGVEWRVSDSSALRRLRPPLIPLHEGIVRALNAA